MPSFAQKVRLNQNPRWEMKSFISCRGFCLCGGLAKEADAQDQRERYSERTASAIRMAVFGRQTL